MSDTSMFIIEDGVLKGVDRDHRQESELIVPEGVTCIGRNAFIGCNFVRRIVLPRGVLSIEKQAVWNCIELESFIIPDGVISIGDLAFAACYRLKRVTIPESVQEIGTDAFDECPLEELFAPGTLISNIKGSKMKAMAVETYIADPDRYQNEAVRTSYNKYLISQRKKWLPIIFERDKVDLLKIYADAKKITLDTIDNDYLTPATEFNALECTSWLLNYKNQIQTGTQFEKMHDFSLSDDPNSIDNMKKTWSFKTLEDGTLELLDYKGTDTIINIPERIGKKTVSRLGAYLFSPEKPRRKKTSCEFLRKVSKVVIPDCVREIGESAFEFSNVSVITLPANLCVLEDNAFMGCGNLSELGPLDAIRDKKVKIGAKPFWGCDSLCNSGGFAIIGDVLYHAKFSDAETLVIPDGVSVIYENALDLLSVFCKKIEMPLSVTSIDTHNINNERWGKGDRHICAPAGSYAEQYAKENGIPFEAK